MSVFELHPGSCFKCRRRREADQQKVFERLKEGKHTHDPGRSASIINASPFQAQRHTIYCLLSCVNTVTSVCPHREEAVLLRLLRTLTRVRQGDLLCGRVLV